MGSKIACCFCYSSNLISGIFWSHSCKNLSNCCFDNLFSFWICFNCLYFFFTCYPIYLFSNCVKICSSCNSFCCISTVSSKNKLRFNLSNYSLNISSSHGNNRNGFLKTFGCTIFNVSKPTLFLSIFFCGYCSLSS